MADGVTLMEVFAGGAPGVWIAAQYRRARNVHPTEVGAD